MGGRGTEGEIGDEEGVFVKDGKGGEEGVWDVKWGGGEEDLEMGRRGGDDGDGVFVMEFFITVLVLYSKAGVGPLWKGGMRGKYIKRGKGWYFSDCRKDRKGTEGTWDTHGHAGRIRVSKVGRGG